MSRGRGDLRFTGLRAPFTYELCRFPAASGFSYDFPYGGAPAQWLCCGAG
jgi:hypothetical protein